jgi:hypothetical protein
MEMALASIQIRTSVSLLRLVFDEGLLLTSSPTDLTSCSFMNIPTLPTPTEPACPPAFDVTGRNVTLNGRPVQNLLISNYAAVRNLGQEYLVWMGLSSSIHTMGVSQRPRLVLLGNCCQC